MKKIFSVVLCLILVLSFSACGKGDETESASSATAKTEQSSSEISTSSAEEYEIETSSKASSTQSKAQSESSKTSSVAPSSSSGTAESQKPAETSSEVSIPKAPDYSSIACRSVAEADFKSIRIKNSQKGLALEIKIPSDWQLSANGEKTYNILRSGKVIGTVSTTEPSNPNEKFEYSSDINVDSKAGKYRQIDWRFESGEGKFYRAFKFNDYPKTAYYEVYFQINYAELDKAAADLIFESAAMSSTIGNAPIPPLPQNSSSKEILILGNSFISSSQIGLILNEMLDKAKSEYSVTAISVGGAYTGTFLENEALMSDIRNGKYCYIFQCGLYSSLAVSTFGPLKEIYDEANVPVVLFPAHNESEGSINSALQQYYDTPILNWKAELDALIDSGISRDTFCQNDHYGHSKPIAGYVGAHMIYRTLFGSMPTDDITSAPIAIRKDYIRSTLGDYVDSGIVPGAVPKEIFVGTEYSIK